MSIFGDSIRLWTYLDESSSPGAMAMCKLFTRSSRDTHCHWRRPVPAHARSLPRASPADNKTFLNTGVGDCWAAALLVSRSRCPLHLSSAHLGKLRTTITGEMILTTISATITIHSSNKIYLRLYSTIGFTSNLYNGTITFYDSIYWYSY